MRKIFTLLAITVFSSSLVLSAQYNLGKLAQSSNIDVFNRTLDPTKAGVAEAVFLNSADDYGMAWITGVDFSNGSIELEIRGENNPGNSFLGVAFHAQCHGDTPRPHSIASPRFPRVSIQPSVRAPQRF